MIEVVLFVLLVFGVAVLWIPEPMDLKKRWGYRLARYVSGFFSDSVWSGAWGGSAIDQLTAHIGRLLQATFSMGTRRSIMLFFILSGTLCICAINLTLWKTSFAATILAGVMAGLSPYLMLQCCLRTRRITGSHEGEILVTELLNNYKINFCNMQQAIEVTAMTIKEAPNSRRLLLNLSKGLHRVSTGTDVEALLRQFRFAIDTAWADILATNIYLACVSGLQVTDALSELARAMIRARQIEEYSRRENSEARLILCYLLPACGLLTVVGGIQAFGLTFSEYLHDQFQTGAGLTWFILWVAVYGVAIIAYLLLSRNKFDL